MIVCENCGADGDEALDLGKSIIGKHDRIIDPCCKRCGSYELVMLDFLKKYVFILEERDEFSDNPA